MLNRDIDFGVMVNNYKFKHILTTLLKNELSSAAKAIFYSMSLEKREKEVLVKNTLKVRERISWGMAQIN